MKSNIKVAVAMSGGVDSSVAATLCVQKYGKENVFGVTMRLFCYASAEQDEKSCCSLAAINDAKAVCDHLGIKHYVIDMEKEFEKTVIKNFVSEYKKGHTPIPCVLCNTVIKFDCLLKKAQALGANMLATGHYARISCHPREGGNLDSGSKPGMTYKLLKGLDEVKDQSYFLYGLNQKQLAHTEFPLGEMKKTEVRKIAAKLGLKTAKKIESKGICFVTEGRVTNWLKGKVKNKPGDIIDTKGNIVGGHEGIVFYTIGQRKRVGGGFPEPMYVIRVDAKKNEVVIGTEKELYGKELVAEEVHWISGTPKFPLKCKAKIRYNMDDAGCVVMQRIENKTQSSHPELPARSDDHSGGVSGSQEIPDPRLNDHQIGQEARNDKEIRVVFTKPQRAITPGQSLVLYKNNKVLGGGIIQ